MLGADSQFLSLDTPDYVMDLPSKVPQFQLNFGSKSQEIIVLSIRAENDKINIFPSEASPNHRYWNTNHHAQGFAWSRDSITVKTTAIFTSQYDSRLEIITSPEIPAVQSDSKRAIAFPLEVSDSSSGCLLIQPPNQQAWVHLELSPGAYTVLFESDASVSSYHWCDFTQRHEATGTLLDNVEEKEWPDSIDESERFSHRYRITIVPLRSETVQVLQADTALAQLDSFQLDSEGRPIAGMGGETLLRARFQLVPSPTAAENPITKFGGQPRWIDEPQWPLSRKTGKPMEFIGQIVLDPKIFGDIPGKVAYIFMSSWDEDRALETWSEDAGENAVIIQPGGTVPVKTKSLATGPSVELSQTFAYGYQPVELMAELIFEEELVPDSFSDSFTGFDCEVRDDWSVDKIGGNPVFIQDDSGGANLILQMEEPVAFSANFGTGRAHVFLTDDRRSGYMFWQTS